jgi:hypothetical protein
MPLPLSKILIYCQGSDNCEGWWGQLYRITAAFNIISLACLFKEDKDLELGNISGNISYLFYNANSYFFYKFVMF